MYYPSLLYRFSPTKTITYNYSLNTTVQAIKFFISSLLQIPLLDQILCFGGKELCGERTLIDYGIQNESTLFLRCRYDSLLGGHSEVLLEVLLCLFLKKCYLACIRSKSWGCDSHRNSRVYQESESKRSRIV